MEIVQVLLSDSRLLAYCAMPVVAAFIGWGTNFIAVRMLFRPHKRRGIWPLRFQGVVPRRQDELAQSIGAVVEKELLSHHDVTAALQTDAARGALLREIDELVSTFLEQKIAANPMLGMFLQGEALISIRAMLMEHIQEKLPELLHSLGSSLESSLKFGEVVESKVASFDVRTLEEIVYRIAKRELKAIEYFGALVGLLIGLGQVGILIAAGG